jgi:hypothetical protein
MAGTSVLPFTKLKALEYSRMLSNFVKIIFTKRESFTDEDPRLTFPMAKYLISELCGCDLGTTEIIDKEIKDFVIYSLEQYLKDVIIDPLVPEYITRNIQNLVYLGKSRKLKGSYFEMTIFPPKNISTVTTFSALSYVILTVVEYNDILKILPSDIKHAMNIVLLSDETSNEIETDPEIEVGNGFDILERDYGLEFSEESKSMFKKCIFHIMSYCIEEDINSQLQRQRINMFASKLP